jgi:hypothetical protein
MLPYLLLNGKEEQFYVQCRSRRSSVGAADDSCCSCLYALQCVEHPLSVQLSLYTGVQPDQACIHHLWEHSAFVDLLQVNEAGALVGASKAAKRIHCLCGFPSSLLCVFFPVQLHIHC